MEPVGGAVVDDGEVHGAGPLGDGCAVRKEELNDAGAFLARGDVRDADGPGGSGARGWFMPSLIEIVEEREAEVLRHVDDACGGGHLRGGWLGLRGGEAGGSTGAEGGKRAAVGGDGRRGGAPWGEERR